MAGILSKLLVTYSMEYKLLRHNTKFGNKSSVTLWFNKRFSSLEVPPKFESIKETTKKENNDLLIKNC